KYYCDDMTPIVIALQDSLVKEFLCATNFSVDCIERPPNLTIHLPCFQFRQFCPDSLQFLQNQLLVLRFPLLILKALFSVLLITEGLHGVNNNRNKKI